MINNPKAEHTAIRLFLFKRLARQIDILRGISPPILWLGLGLLMFGLSITVFSALYMKAQVDNALQKELDFIGSEIQQNISTRLTENAQLLYSGAALFDVSDGMVTRSDWRTFTNQLHIEKMLPGTQGIGFSVLIQPAQMQQHLQEIRSQGFPDYQVKPAGVRDIYSSIIYLEPFDGLNLRAFGYDMFSEPVRREAMQRARDENGVALSGKVVLVQEIGQDIQPGALMYVPVYRHGLPIETIEQRRAAIIGWVYSPYRMTDLIHGTLRNWDFKQSDRQIALQIYDGELPSADALLYDSHDPGQKIAAAATSISKLIPVDFGGHRWTLRITQLGGLATTADYGSVWLVFVSGALISLLLCGLTISLLSTRVNSQHMADHLTAELRASEEKYRIVFNNEIYAICIFDLETLLLLEVNQAFEHLYGYSREELLSGMGIHDITAEHQASERATVKAVRDGTTFIPLRYHCRKDGSIFPVEIVGGPYVWQGRNVMFALAHDIADRKNAEDALRESEMRFRVMADSAPVLVWMSGTDAMCNHFNKPWLEFTGRTLDQELGMGWTEGLYPDDYQTCLDKYLAAFNAKREFKMEYRLRRSDGEYRTLIDNGIPRFTQEGVFLGYIGTCVDITERKQVEDSFKQVNKQLINVMEGTRDVIAMIDTSYHYTLFNSAFHAEFKHIFGVDIKPGDSMLDALVHFPEDLSDARNYWQRALAGEDFIISQQFGDTKRERNWYELHFSPISDDEGKVINAIHIVRNITDRKYAEAALQESEEKYRFVADFTSDWELWREPDGTYKYVSPACERITGYLPAEFIENPELIIQITHPDDMPMVIAHYDVNHIGIMHQDRGFDYRIITKSGNIRWLNHKCAAVYSQDGIWLGRRESNRDITERKSEEEIIQELNIELEQLASTDVLTGINNHRALMKLAEREVEVAMRYKLPLSIMFFDIDNFKRINDIYGHAIGDQALIKTVQAVCDGLRSADLIGRFGGDEFVVLLPQTNAQDALSLAERIHARIAAMHLDTEKGVISLSISLGIAQTTHNNLLNPTWDGAPAETVENLLLRADQAMYAAKRAGKNCSRIFGLAETKTS